AKLLNSMISCDIPLPTQIISRFTNPGEPTYRFDEVAYAVARQRLWKSWEKFKKQQEADSSFLCMKDEADEGVESEGFDYGSNSAASVALRLGAKPDVETTLDLYVIGRAISPELVRIMESMHAAEPCDGYQPI